VSLSPESGSSVPVLMNYEQAAAYLGTSPRHLRRLWVERRIGGVKLNKLVRFRQKDLDAFIEANFYPPLPRLSNELRQFGKPS
jgi:excisionase family DNA binding protein